MPYTVACCELPALLRVQDLDSGHHGSGFPLPPFRQALLERHLAAQEAAGALRKASRKKKRSAEGDDPQDSDGASPCPGLCAESIQVPITVPSNPRTWNFTMYSGTFSLCGDVSLL